jgi:hypothetical protein
MEEGDDNDNDDDLNDDGCIEDHNVNEDERVQNEVWESDMNRVGEH